MKAETNADYYFSNLMKLAEVREHRAAWDLIGGSTSRPS
jgi:hypothetical protein